MSAGLLTAGSGHAWETDLVAALDRPGAPFTVVRRCADLADVLAMASTGQATVCVLSSDLRRFDSEAVRRLVGLGLTIVAVHPAGDARAPARLGRIGITSTVPDDAGPPAILEALTAAADGSAGTGGTVPADDAGVPPSDAPGTGSPRSPRGGAASVGPAGPYASRDPAGPDGPRDPDGSDAPGAPAGRFGRLRRRSRQDPVVADPSSALAVGSPDPGRDADGRAAGPSFGLDASLPSGPAAGRPGDGQGRDGPVVAVWGPIGAPGRSTVAMGIADEAAAAGHSVMLIDADVYGGVLAAAFGLLDESPGLAGACRMASNGRLDGAALTGLCWAVGPRLSLLTGIARADRWPEVRPSAVPMVLAVARGLADLVVVDCAAILETDEEISFDTMAPRRNGATLAVLAEADVVLAVGAGDPPGIERLVRGLAHLAEAVPEASPRVVVNRTRRSAASTREIADALARFTGLGILAHLPEDREATDRAWRRCVGLSEAAPRSQLRAGLVALSRSIVPVRSGVASTVGAAARPDGASGDAESGVPIGGDVRRGAARRGRHFGSLE